MAGEIFGQLLANRANRKLAEYQYSKDIEMWNRTNEYNSPTSQMSRLEEAGLNPNMLYGSGVSGATGQAKEMPKYQAPRLTYEMKLDNAMNFLNKYQEMKVNAAKVNNLEQTTRSISLKNIVDAAAQWWDIESRKERSRKLSGERSSAWSKARMYTIDENIKRLLYESGSQIMKYQSEASSAWYNSMIREIERNWAKANQWINAGAKIVGTGAGAFGASKLGGVLKKPPTINKYYNPSYYGN